MEVIGVTSAVTVVVPIAIDAAFIITAFLAPGPQDRLGILSQMEAVEGLLVTKGRYVFR